MRLQPLPSRLDPIAAAVADVLDATADDFTRADREMMAWTEGVLTAAAIGPERTRPDEWARAVFGAEPVYDDAAQAQASLTMLALMYNGILSELHRRGPDYVPVFLDCAEEGEAVALGAHWAAGFIAGTQLRGEAWESLILTEQGKLRLSVIVGLLTDSEGKSLFLKGEPEEIAAAREDALGWLGLAVHEISEHWRTRTRQMDPGKIDPFRKTGRNDPCPCGSGKKYKKCCLDA
jgi:uncharacterized protein